MGFAGLVHGQTTRPAIAEFNYDGIPLSDALQDFRQRTGLNLSIDWAAMQAAGVDKTTTVSVTVHGLTAGKLLGLMLDSAAPNHQLTYYVEGGVVHITTQAVADQDMITRAYPIEDLLIQHENFQNVPFINIANSQAATVGGGSQQSPLQSSGQPNPQETEQQKQKTVDAIIAAITSSIRPGIWKQNGGTASIWYFNGELIVTAPRSVQSAIAGH